MDYISTKNSKIIATAAVVFLIAISLTGSIAHADEALYSEPIYSESYQPDTSSSIYSEPFYSEPQVQSYGDPLYSEPLYSEPYQQVGSDIYSEPLYSEPLYSESINPYSEPLYSEPLYSEPLYSEPLYSEQLYSEPLYSDQGYGGYSPSGYADSGCSMCNYGGSYYNSAMGYGQYPQYYSGSGMYSNGYGSYGGSYGSYMSGSSYGGGMISSYGNMGSAYMGYGSTVGYAVATQPIYQPIYSQPVQPQYVAPAPALTCTLTMKIENSGLAWMSWTSSQGTSYGVLSHGLGKVKPNDGMWLYPQTGQNYVLVVYGLSGQQGRCEMVMPKSGGSNWWTSWSGSW